MPSVSRRFGGYVKVKRKPRPTPRPEEHQNASHAADPLVGESVVSINTSFLAPRRAPPRASAWQRLRLPLFVGLALLVASFIFVLAARSDKSYVDASSLSASARSSGPAYVGAARRETGTSGAGAGGAGGVSHAQAFLAANLAKHGGRADTGGTNTSKTADSDSNSVTTAGYLRFKNERCEINSETPSGAAESMTRCLSLGRSDGN